MWKTKHLTSAHNRVSVELQNCKNLIEPKKTKALLLFIGKEFLKLYDSRTMARHCELCLENFYSLKHWENRVRVDALWNPLFFIVGEYDTKFFANRDVLFSIAVERGWSILVSERFVHSESALLNNWVWFDGHHENVGSGCPTKYSDFLMGYEEGMKGGVHHIFH